METEAPKHLECSICMNLLYMPRTACCNMHVFCEGCLEKHYTTPVVDADMLFRTATCPECRAEIVCTGGSKDAPMFQPMPIVAACVDSLRIFCPNDGCNEKITIGTLEEHKKTCSSAVGQWCPYASLGCDCTFRKGEIDAHMADYAEQHQSLLAKAVSEVHKERKAYVTLIGDVSTATRRDFDLLFKKVATLESTVCALDRKMFNVETAVNTINNQLAPKKTPTKASASRRSTDVRDDVQPSSKRPFSAWLVNQQSTLHQATEQAEAEADIESELSVVNASPVAPGAPVLSQARRRVLRQRADDDHSDDDGSGTTPPNERVFSSLTQQRWVARGVRQRRPRFSIRERDQANHFAAALQVEREIGPRSHSPTSPPSYRPNSPTYSPTAPGYEPPFISVSTASVDRE